MSIELITDAELNELERLRQAMYNEDSDYYSTRETYQACLRGVAPALIAELRELRKENAEMRESVVQTFVKVGELLTLLALRDEVEPMLRDAKESQTAPHYLRIAAANLLDRFYKEKE